MLLEKGVLVNKTENVTARDHASNLEFSVGLEGPLCILVKTWKFNTSWDEHTIGLFCNFFQWSLNSIENSFQNTRSEFDRQWVACSEDGITISQARGILVALDGSSVTFESDDLTDQLVPADFNELVHFGSGHVFTDDDCQKNQLGNQLNGRAFALMKRGIGPLVFRGLKLEGYLRGPATLKILPYFDCFSSKFSIFILD